MVDTVQQSVQDYYSKTLKTTDDLQTSACCPVGTMPKHLLPYIQNIHDDVQAKFYGCGAPLPYELRGLSVLDLGCGTGRDCFLLSQLVGQTGTVIGVDMTDDQLQTARDTLQWHTDKFGYNRPNIEFMTGFMEDLDTLGIEDESIDLVISNCVFNLSANKPKLFSEIFRVLKPGGELYFSDVFADRRLSKEIQNDPILWGECLGGALYIEDFRRLMHHAGCADYRVMSGARITVNNPALENRAGGAQFSSITMRAFKLELEDQCEDYGQTAQYLGTIEHCPERFILDNHHEFPTKAVIRVCGNTADMLSETRLAKHFNIKGDKSCHLGLFDCATDKTAAVAACC